MIGKLEGIKQRFDVLTEKIADPAVIARMDEWQKIAKERADMEETVNKYIEYKKYENDKKAAEESLATETDSEMKAGYEEEILNCKKQLEIITEELKILLLPKDPNDDKNVILEIRGGAGGEEAALFAFELYRMYTRYAERNRWKVEEIDINQTELGGVKEVTFSISGKGAYSRLKYESGVHRVQRVPETESQGRVHTSTSTVAVLPEVEDVEVNIEEKDLIIETCRSSGAGGQHINKTESCIRMVHIPTGIVVNCQDERSQIKNREKAMKVMKSRLYDYYNSKYMSEYAENRKSQVGTGDRSERIRTYNYPQGRVTDHRIGFTLYNLPDFLMGDIDEMIDALAISDREKKLASQNDD
ncbi:MAG: peptide chain release factor 1 [Clostridia bacterium]|nr:peptide chain release factor 1 [Clostridia bacterium]